MSARRELIDRGLRRLESVLQGLRERVDPDAYGDGLAPITLEDRPIIIKFMTEVYHEGMDEHLWAAKHPDEYRRIAAIAGTVPKEKPT